MSNETTVYQQCTNRQKSQTAKMTIGVPIVTCLRRVRRIHKARSTDHIRLSIGPTVQIQLYLVPFLSYLMLNNNVTLKFGLQITQRSMKLLLFDILGAVTYSPSFPSNYGRIFN